MMRYVDEAFSTRKWAKVKHVKGTDKQGEYKHATGRYDPILKVAWAAQRLKTRAVFTEEEEQNSPVDWVCYIDDDMVVNCILLLLPCDCAALTLRNLVAACLAVP